MFFVSRLQKEIKHRYDSHRDKTEEYLRSFNISHIICLHSVTDKKSGHENSSQCRNVLV